MKIHNTIVGSIYRKYRNNRYIITYVIIFFTFAQYQEGFNLRPPPPPPPTHTLNRLISNMVTVCWGCLVKNCITAERLLVEFGVYAPQPRQLKNSQPWS